MKDQLVKELCDKKAQENNTIDLNAYAIGLQDMLTALTTPVDVQEVERLAAEAYPIKMEEVESSRSGQMFDANYFDREIFKEGCNAIIKHITAAQQPSQWEKALVSLTPGGSEFAGDPERCVEWVKEHIKSIAEIAKNSIKEKRQPSQWVEIKSEKDLQELPCYCWVWDGVDSYYAYFNQILREFIDENEDAYFANITHYIPITKPAPPIHKP